MKLAINTCIITSYLSFRGPGTCRYGNNCFFRHDNDVTNKTSLHGAQIAKEVKVHSASGACSDSGEEDKENEAVAIDTEKDTEKGSKKWKKRSPGKHKKSPKGHEKYLSVQVYCQINTVILKIHVIENTIKLLHGIPFLLI